MVCVGIFVNVECAVVAGLRRWPSLNAIALSKENRAVVRVYVGMVLSSSWIGPARRDQAKYSHNGKVLAAVRSLSDGRNMRHRIRRLSLG